MSEIIERESTDLVELPAKESALTVYSTVGGLDPLIEQIKDKVAGTVYDMSTAKGRDECRSDAAKVGRSKTAIEKLGKALSAEYKEIPKKIDAERKRAFDTLEALQKQVRQPLTDWEQAEEDRIAKHKAGIQHIKGCGDGFIGGQPAAFGLLFRELEENIAVDASWEEFEPEAHRAKTEALAKLKAVFADHQKREAEQAELAELRRKQAEQEQKDRDAEIARKAAEQAKADAEAKARAERDAAAKAAADAQAAADKRELELKLQAEKAEREKVEAQQAAEKAERDAKARADAAAQAERQRQADETARIEAETKAREADRTHKSSVMRQAKEAIIAIGLNEKQAVDVVKLIVAGKVPNVRIHF